MCYDWKPPPPQLNCFYNWQKQLSLDITSNPFDLSCRKNLTCGQHLRSLIANKKPNNNLWIATLLFSFFMASDLIKKLKLNTTRLESSDFTVYINLFLHPEHVNICISFKCHELNCGTSGNFTVEKHENMTYPPNQSASQCGSPFTMKAGKQRGMQVWACVWQVVSQSIHIYALSLGIVHLRYNTVITVNPAISPANPWFSFVLSSNLLPSQRAVHFSLPLPPFSFFFSWKSKQALVEQPHSLATLAGQMSYKNSWCYGNPHFTDNTGEK